jgi:L-lysine 2,3-aminomutase
MASVTLESRRSAAPARADWQSVLAEAVRSPAEVCRLLGLEPALAAAADRAATGFPLLVPRPYLARIRPGDPADPLLRQVLPQAAELVATPGFGPDPLDEAKTACGPGLLHLLQKYRGRILMVTTGSCAVHCRYCFRRHFPYRNALGVVSSGTQWDGALVPRPESLGRSRKPTRCNGWALPDGTHLLEDVLKQIAADPSIHEVILSGGDPLALPDAELAQIVGRLAEISHLRRLRIHTRLPVMIPQRITDELPALLRGNRLSPIMVVQVNHPAEIDPAVAEAFGRLVDAGVPLLNQAVLLRGVNDRADVLAELCERLVDLRVMPYYLHQLDPVAGAAHFEVPIETGRALMAALRARLPGYAVPRYVRETRGGTSKEVLA